MGQRKTVGGRMVSGQSGVTFTFMHLADAFFQSVQAIHYFISMCVYMVHGVGSGW